MDGENGGPGGIKGHAQGHRDMPKIPTTWVWDGVAAAGVDRDCWISCLLLYAGPFSQGAHSPLFHRGREGQTGGYGNGQVHPPRGSRPPAEGWTVSPRLIQLLTLGPCEWGLVWKVFEGGVKVRSQEGTILGWERARRPRTSVLIGKGTGTWSEDRAVCLQAKGHQGHRQPPGGQQGTVSRRTPRTRRINCYKPPSPCWFVTAVL